MQVPESFLAKILKPLVEKGLVRATRGAHGGYGLARPARDITFLDVIEAVEGPVQVALCNEHAGGCQASRSCTLYGVWKQGTARMLEVFRSTTLDTLAMSELRPSAPGLVSLTALNG
jgi:Rrf2 family protein